MAAWVCDECTTVYAVEAPCCPHCGSTDWTEQGAEMPKITRAAGATHELDTENDDTGTALPAAVEGDDTEQVAGEEFDPGAYTVTEVNAYLDECRADGNPDEATRVLELERAGKNRAGILNRA